MNSDCYRHMIENKVKPEILRKDVAVGKKIMRFLQANACPLISSNN